MEGIKNFLLLNADDQVIFAKSPEALQTMLLDIEHYCNTWDLKINTSNKNYDIRKVAIQVMIFI